MKEKDSNSIDNYEITETIHDSLEGIIYRAVETSSGTKVLIKKYYPSLAWSDEVLDDFFNLLGYLRFIEHEYLLPILDIGKHESQPYVVFADNSVTLLCNRQAGQVSQQEALPFLHHTAEALDFLHKQEILHGTLNPANIAIDADGYPQLFDFGLSGVFKKLLLENTDDGFDNLSISNLKSTSPEQVQGRTPTRTSDIYAFGVIGYYYIFGDFPFSGRSVQEIAAFHLHNGVTRIVHIPDAKSKPALQILQKCFQVDPNARFAGFSQVLAILERAMAGKRNRIVFNKRIEFTTVKKRRSFPLARYVLAFFVVAGIFTTYYFYSQNISSTLSVATSSSSTTVAHQPTSQELATSESIAITASPAIENPSTPPIQNEGAHKPAFEGEEPVFTSKVVSIENILNLQEISRLGYGKPEEVAVSPENNYFAVASSAGVFIFNGNQLFTWIDPKGWATSVQFSTDGAILAIGLVNGEIQLWDWRNNVKTAILTEHTDKINRILMLQGDLMYSASSDRNIIVWNLKSLKSIKTISAHSRPVNDIAITSDGRTLISCSDDQLIRVWDLASGDKLYELDSNNDSDFVGNVKAVAISPDDSYFAAGGDFGLLYQWKLITSSVVTNPVPQLRTDIVPVNQRIWSLQYIRDGKDLLVGVDGGESIIYDAARQEYEGITFWVNLFSNPPSLVDIFGPTFDFASFSIFGDGNIISINWAGSVTNQEAQVVSPMYDLLDRLDFSPNGAILAAGGRRGTTHVWNLSTNEPIYKNFYFMPFGDPITPDGSAIAIISGETMIDSIYQMKNLFGSQSVRDFSRVIPNGVVSYSHDGSVFISANLTQSKAWDFASGYETYFESHPNNGCWITSSTNNNEVLQINSPAGVFSNWDGRAGNLCPTSYQFRGGVSTFSDSLSLMVYVNLNGVLEGYDLLTGKTIWRYIPENPITAAAVSPDGSMVAIGNTSGMMIFINGKSGAFIHEITGNFGRLQAIEFSEDGKKIASAGSDGTARIFGIVDNK